MYICSHCGNYKSFTVSIPETVTNKLTKVYGREYEAVKFEEELLYVKCDIAMQDIEDTLVCDDCEGMGVVDVESKYLDIELQGWLYQSLKMGVLDVKLQKKMKKEALSVGDEVNEEGLETENN